MKKIFTFLIVVLGSLNAQGQAPSRLRCDLLLNTNKVYQAGLSVNEKLENAINQKEKYQYAYISNSKPTFSWEIAQNIKKSTAFRVLVSSKPELLNESKADFWDSQKISSSKNQVIYSGKNLEENKTYYWKVQVFDANGKASPFSEISSFYLSSPNSDEPFAHHPLMADIQKPQRIISTKPNSYFLDFGKDALGQLQLHLTSPKTDSVWIEVGEALENPTKIHKNAGRTIRYLKVGLWVKEGTHDYTIEWQPNEKRNSRNPIQMPAYIGEVFPFRYVSIENFAGKITKESIKRKMVYYPFDENASSFTSSDTVLNQIWDLCKYSMKATSFTGYYIDGDRERIPYEADALINQLSHYAVDAEYSIGRRSMNYLIYHPTWPTEWTLQNVLLAWNDYMYTGDDLFLKKYYSELQRKVLLPLAGTNGLISTRTNKQTDEFLQSLHITKTFDGRRGLHDIVDWPQNGDYIGNEKEHKGESDGFVFNTYNSVINAYYYRNLVLMQKIAKTLGKTSDAEMYETKAKEVASSFLKVFQDTQTGLIKDGDSTNHSSQHANMFALAFGLIPIKDVEKVKNFIKSRRMACSVYASQFLMDALYEAGEQDYGLELLTSTAHRSWYNMIRVGSTITLEAWDKIYKPNLDWNHAWGAVPGNIIVRKLVGIEPIQAGFEKFQIKPQIGKLTQVSLKTPTIKGKIWVEIQKNSDKTTMKVEIPAGTNADVFVPSEPNKLNISLNGKKQNIKPSNGYFEFKNLAEGTFTFLLEP